MPRHPFLAALVFAVSLCVFLPTPSTAEVRLPPVLSSRMVLQRDMPVPIWRTATAGEKATISFRGQEKSAAADHQGKWLVKLDPVKAGGPDVLKIALRIAQDRGPSGSDELHARGSRTGLSPR